jgi:hypothetical protein
MKALIGERYQGIERIVMITMILALLVTNILSISSNKFHGSLYDLLSHIPYETLLNNSPMKKQRLIETENLKLLRQKQELIAKRAHYASHAHTVAKRITLRTAKNLSTNITSVVGEAVPYLGAALVVSVTAMDVKDGCDTVRDMKELLRTFEVDAIDDESYVCGMKVPNVDEVLMNIKQDIGGTVYQSKEITTETARKFYDTLGGTLNEMFN